MDGQGGDEDNAVTGVSPRESMRWDSPMLREEGLIAQMEREAMEAGLGGWFNGNLEDVQSRRAGVGPTPARQSVRIESGRLS